MYIVVGSDPESVAVGLFIFVALVAAIGFTSDWIAGWRRKRADKKAGAFSTLPPAEAKLAAQNLELLYALHQIAAISATLDEAKTVARKAIAKVQNLP